MTVSRPPIPPPSPWLLAGTLVCGQWAYARRRSARVRADAERRVRAAESMAAEHAELHRAAALVARGESPDEVCMGVARAAATLLGAQVGLVVRLDGPGRGKLVGRHLGAPMAGYPELGDHLRFDPAGAIGQVLASGRASRAEQGAASPFVSALGQRIAAPILLDGGLWGALAVSSAPGRILPPDAENRLARFAELVALAIGNAEARQRLISAASTDPLTGLANHRTFQSRLEQEVEQAHRSGRPLSLALIDIDRFKQINDTFGHLAGDRVLTEVAARLRATMRGEVLLARIGGDEFVAVLPDTSGADAAQLSARLHAVVRSEPVDGDLRVTVSIGVSELGLAEAAQDLHQHADEALYAAKRGGRDAVRTGTGTGAAVAEGASAARPGEAQSTGR
ncbi:MAG TPA: sensor domain-containing diguanylate cyclase [Solirubrobacteraceae bacterium]|nr:sensor domain-containing diguanylate cyclase [Solirubrobacteraceae bacterium]